MNRRRILLSYLANSFSWELYSKTYFYNELVPTTINSKNVLNKAKIVKVSGNGVIENQLINPTVATQTINGVTFTNNGDGSWTVNGTATANTLKTVSSVFQTISGHYYLICGCANGGSNSTYRLLESYTYRWSDTNGSGYIQVANTSGNASLIVEVKSGTTCNNLIFKPQFNDLTLMFGTGNEPTTLTDNRIQNILNRGYIPFNLGEYKESDIGVVSTTKADTTALDTITFKAQLGGAINSHNTMEITNSAYVFTRNQWKYNLGDYYWSRQYAYGRYEFYNTKLRGVAKNSTSNVICSSYTTGSRTDLADKQMAFESDGTFIVRDDAYTTDSDFRTAVTGKYIHYELATPQVITIPKKHLGIVDLGSLNWEYTSGTYSRFTAVVNDIKPVSQVSDTGNIYCSNFITDSVSNIYSHTKDKSIGVHNSARIWVYDSAYTNATDLQNAMSGILLFYETENEVADIENIIDIESGGTITTDSEVLANIELSVKCK